MQCFFIIWFKQLTFLTLAGPLIPSHYLGLLQTQQQVCDRESLSGEACREPETDVTGVSVIHLIAVYTHKAFQQTKK